MKRSSKLWAGLVLCIVLVLYGLGRPAAAKKSLRSDPQAAKARRTGKPEKTHKVQRLAQFDPSASATPRGAAIKPLPTASGVSSAAAASPPPLRASQPATSGAAANAASPGTAPSPITNPQPTLTAPNPLCQSNKNGFTRIFLALYGLDKSSVQGLRKGLPSCSDWTWGIQVAVNTNTEMKDAAAINGDVNNNGISSPRQDLLREEVIKDNNGKDNAKRMQFLPGNKEYLLITIHVSTATGRLAYLAQRFWGHTSEVSQIGNIEETSDLTGICKVVGGAGLGPYPTSGTQGAKLGWIGKCLPKVLSYITENTPRCTPPEGPIPRTCSPERPQALRTPPPPAPVPTPAASPPKVDPPPTPPGPAQPVATGGNTAQGTTKPTDHPTPQACTPWSTLDHLKVWSGLGLIATGVVASAVMRTAGNQPLVLPSECGPMGTMSCGSITHQRTDVAEALGIATGAAVAFLGFDFLVASKYHKRPRRRQSCQQAVAEKGMGPTNAQSSAQDVSQ